jgi:hypothetical protein
MPSWELATTSRKTPPTSDRRIRTGDVLGQKNALRPRALRRGV